MTKISVLMPIYNTNEKHLREAIESILNQSYKDFEFLILNDSPDNINLDKVVKSYADPRIVYLKNEKNMGITPSRNRLLDMAKGEYLAIMDHDDISLPERFKKQVEFLDNNPDYGVVGSNYIEFPRLKKSNQFQDDSQIKISLMRSCAVLHPSSMIRKNIITCNNINYKEEFSPAEDYALWVDLVVYAKFHNLKDCLLKYRKHKTNTSKLQAKKMLIARDLIYDITKTKHPDLYEKFMMSATKKTRISLFGFIPFLKVETKQNKSKIKLFGVLPIATSKTTIKL